MDFIIELILEILLEGSVEIIKIKKIPKYIRYPLIALVTIFFTIVIIGMFALGCILVKKSFYGGLFIILVSLILLICAISKVQASYIEFKNSEKKLSEKNDK